MSETDKMRHSTDTSFLSLFQVTVMSPCWTGGGWVGGLRSMLNISKTVLFSNINTV